MKIPPNMWTDQQGEHHLAVQEEQWLDMLTWQETGGEAAGEPHHWLQCLTLITFLWKCCDFYSMLMEENCQVLLDIHLHFI